MEREKIEMEMPMPVALAFYEAWLLFHEVTGRHECMDEFIKALSAAWPKRWGDPGSRVRMPAAANPGVGQRLPKWVALQSMLEAASAKWAEQNRPESRKRTASAE